MNQRLITIRTFRTPVIVLRFTSVTVIIPDGTAASGAGGGGPLMGTQPTLFQAYPVHNYKRTVAVNRSNDTHKGSCLKHNDHLQDDILYCNAGCLVDNTKNVERYVTVDFYRTQFQNQIFPDYDTDPTKAIISNFTGTPVSNGFQVEFYTNFFSRFEVKSAYNYLDVYRIVNREKIISSFNPIHKILTTLSYKLITNKWHIDVNIHWFGKQRLPNTSNNPIEFQRPDHSQPYTLFNAQFTKNWKKFEDT